MTRTKKRALALAKALFIKSGDDLLSHENSQYHWPKLIRGINSKKLKILRFAQDDKNAKKESLSVS